MLSKSKILSSIIAVAGLAVAAIDQEAVAQNAATLPGGASSLQETYDDWMVACVINDQSKNQKLCALSQQQVDKNSRQRVLAVEWRPKGDGIEGIVFLPFGLALAKGAAFQFDDGPFGKPADFSTCLPAGCLVPIDFNKDILAAMRKASRFNVKAIGQDGKDVSFTISLKGFSTAFDRTRHLAGG